MIKNSKKYFRVLSKLFNEIAVTSTADKICSLDEAMCLSTGLINNCAYSGGKLFFIGNGASASIASHMATDFWKNAKIKALSFNDSSLLTCVSNDFGYQHVFEKPIEMFADKGDMLFAISSSGKSQNILRASRAAKKKGLKVITFSGFKKNNPLRKIGDINFYVPSNEYGFVETIHAALCHCLVDMIINSKSTKKDENNE